jgi:heme exporter protein B
MAGYAMSLMSACFAIARREISLGWGAGGGALLPASFFAGAVMVAPFALGPAPDTLGRIGPGYLWLGMALATLVSLERLFQSDLEDGTLDQLVLSSVPLELIVLFKTLGQWVATALPLITISPIAAIMLRASPNLIMPLCAQLAIGSLALFLIGAIGAALGASVRRGGLLVALLALPLYAPTVIFGAGSAALLANGGAIFSQPFLFLCALVLVSLALAPLAAAAALRLHID